MEARLLALQRDRRHGVDRWELLNSPGIPISMSRLRESPLSLLTADQAKVHVYERLTTILRKQQEHFNMASTARGGSWTEWFELVQPRIEVAYANINHRLLYDVGPVDQPVSTHERPASCSAIVVRTRK